MDTASSQDTKLNELTSAIISAAIAVHRALGPGLLEGAYLACLCCELQEAGLQFELERAVPLVYKSVRLDCAYRMDLVVEDCVVVEVKALESLAPIHPRQVLTYMRLFGAPVGLILNFGARTMREGIKRVVNEFPDRAEEAKDAEKS